MASANNWAAAAAAELSGVTVHSVMVAIIEKHCPFTPGVAYMPVPRCDSCAKWSHDAERFCSHFDTTTAPNDGCVQHEPKDQTT